MTPARQPRILVLLAAATLVPIGLLTWLGVRALRQDQHVERQRQRDALEVAAGGLALEIERRFRDIEEQLAQGGDVRLSAAGPVPSDRPLLYGVPSTPAEDDARSVFAEGEVAEHQRGDFVSAARIYRAAAQSTTAAGIRAHALVRLGRVLRKTGDQVGALRTYEQLQALDRVVVGGQPAALIARHVRCRMLAEAGDFAALRREAAEFGRLVNAGGWPIDRDTFFSYQDMLASWGVPVVKPQDVARTDAAITLWRSWRAGELPSRGRLIIREKAAPVAAVWSSTAAGAAVWLATGGELEALLEPVLLTSKAFSVSAHDGGGGRLFGASQPGAISLMPSDTRLPFILSVAPDATVGTASAAGGRRIILVSGLLLAFVLTAGAAYGLYRVTTRELALAQQQKDFVSAVTHEFRTPLTSMRHLTDMLATRGVASEERRTHYYELLARETERLNRLVETLLSFGRIEAGAYAWRQEPLDIRGLLRGVIAEFRQEPDVKGREIRCDIDEAIPSVVADADALSRAVWNLLENAVKYSTPGAAVLVTARRSGTVVQLAVSDHGPGIRSDEQEQIFRKFVRGADARQAGLRGVGIGLALVKRIVEAHGGSVHVDSAPGQGSTFTISLPAATPS